MTLLLDNFFVGVGIIVRVWVYNDRIFIVQLGYEVTPRIQYVINDGRDLTDDRDASFKLVDHFQPVRMLLAVLQLRIIFYYIGRLILLWFESKVMRHNYTHIF